MKPSVSSGFGKILRLKSICEVSTDIMSLFNRSAEGFSRIMKLTGLLV